MKVLKLGNSAVDLAAENIPFNAGNTLILVNLTGGQLVLQSSDVTGSGYGTLATIPAYELQAVTLDKQFIKVSTAAELFLIGN